MSDFGFAIKQNDLLPVLTATLKDALGVAVDLTGATAVFRMGLVGAATLKVNTAATVDPDQVANKGKITYNWTGTDTDTVGIYEGEFTVTLSGGKQQTFPNPRHIVVHIDRRK